MSALNGILFQWIHQFAGRSIALDWLGIFLAEYLPYLLMVVFLILVFYEKGWRRRFYLFAECAVAIMISRGIVDEVIRFFYHHERPFSFFNFTPLIPEAGWSFPSGHASWFFAVAMIVWYANRKAGIWFFVLAALNGIARVYVGVHWPYDILAGVVVGILSAMLVHRLFRPERELLYREPAPSLSG